MSSEYHPLQQEKPKEPLPEYTSFIDRTLISIGDKAVKYWPLVIIGAIVVMLSITMLIGGLVAVRAVGERFNQLDAKQQERNMLEEQLLDQNLKDEEDQTFAPSPPEEIDQSRWFRVLEDEPLEEETESESDDLFFEEIENQASNIEIEERVLQKPPQIKLLIAQDNTWHLSCSGRGLSENGAEECVLQNPRPLPTGDLAATSN